MKFLAISLFIALAFNNSACAQEKAKQYEIAKPPSCVNNLGEPVEFRERVGGRLQVAAGMANRDGKKQPFVLRMNYAFSPPEFQSFIDHHECAHHQTGDVDRPHPPRNGPEHLMNESISDCIAIMFLRDEQAYDETKLNAVENAMRKDMVKIGFPEISISSRISNMKNCYKKEDGSAEFIKIIEQRRAEIIKKLAFVE